MITSSQLNCHVDRTNFQMIWNLMSNPAVGVNSIVVVQPGFDLSEVAFVFLNAKESFEIQQLHAEEVVKYVTKVEESNQQLKIQDLLFDLNNSMMNKLIDCIYMPPIYLIKFV